MLTRTLIAATLTLALGGAPLAHAKEAPTWEQVNEMMKAEDFKGATKALNAIVKESPEDAKAQMLLGYNLIRLGKYDKAVAAYEAAEALGQPTSFIRYNIACARALGGDIEGAFTALQASVDGGWNAAEHLEKDTDLDPLKADPRFEAILAQAKRNAAPCRNDDAYLAMGFFAGEWAAVRKDGQMIAVHTITLAEEGCGFNETWKSKTGNGQALTWYNPGTETWNKQWLGAAGWTISLEGQLDGEVLTLMGASTMINKPGKANKVVFELQDDGSLRNTSWYSLDGGKSWETDFDGQYIPLERYKAEHPEVANKN